MEAEPFEFDNSQATTLKGDDLEKIVKQFGGRKQKVEKKTDAKSEKKVDKKAEKKAKPKTKVKTGTGTLQLQ
jgi:hypothetical protein